MKSDTIVLLLISLSVVIAIATAAWFFLVNKNYVFTVEAACDPSSQNCFHRDCSNADTCPPNGLENYRVFKVTAKDFEKCVDDSCLNECLSETIACTELSCGESGEDSCSLNPERATQ